MKNLYNCLIPSELKETGGGNLRIRILVLTLLLTVSISGKQPLSAQQRTVTISGVVLDESGAPLPGVTVIDSKKPTVGTTSGAQGNYAIIVGRDCDSLRFSFVGYVTQTVSVRNAALVRMKPDTQDIGEVVVTGIYTRKAESYTGAARTLSSKELTRVGNQNALQSLKNLDPTIYIPNNLTMGSDPNTLPSISMRGTSSFPATESSVSLRSKYENQPNQPLFILDGFETSIETVMDMDMNRIESMTILKDASAKALYGSKAANGVIIIETKRSMGSEPVVTYNGSVSFEVPDLSSYDLCNAFEKLEVERREGLYTSNDPKEQAELTATYNMRRKLAMEGLDTYWLAKPLQTAVGHKHNLMVELGDPQKLKTILDATYNSVPGVMKESKRENISANANVSYRTKKLIFRNIMSVISNKSADSPYGSFGDYSKMNPFWQATDADGNVYRYAEGSDGYQSQGGSSPTLRKVANPLYDATIGTSLTSSYLKFTNNFYVEWQILESLKAVGRFGISQQRDNGDDFYPATHSKFVDYSENDYLLRGEYTLETGKSSSVSGDLNLNFNKNIGKHYLFANAGMSISETKSSAYQFKAQGFPNSQNADITFARQYAEGTIPSGYSSLNRQISFLVAASYSYDNRYLLDATINESASSLFGADNRWAFSWSLGVGWNLHNEAFMQSQDLIEELKIRASAGVTGNQNFSTNSAIATYQYYTGVNYQGQTGAYLQRMPNPLLRWEQKTEYNVGLDLRMKRFSLTADVYSADTKNMLTDVTIPTSTGFSSVKDNLGLVRNYGFELQGNVTAWQNHNGFVNIYGSIAYNKNRIIRLSESMRSYNDAIKKAAADAGNSTPVLMYQDGQSMNTIWAVPSAGIDPMTGEEVYIKQDGTLTYTYDADDMVACGISESLYRGTFGFTAEYKGLGVSTTFSYLGGGQLYNTTLVNRIENVDIAYNVDRRVLSGRWTTPGQITQFKKYDSSTSTRPTSRFVQDQNELNFASASLYYEFPRRIASAMRMQRLRVTFYMNDIFTVSSIKIERGLDYPFARYMSLAINATF